MIGVICAVLSGVTIVVSRSINGYLSQKIGPYPSTFFNYLTGFISSLIITLFILFSNSGKLALSHLNTNPTMYIGGIIGVINVLLLNIIVFKISPIKLTLITFIAQLISGMVLDYLLFNIFTSTKFIGCLLVIGGLIVYQLSEKPVTALIKEIED